MTEEPILRIDITHRDALRLVAALCLSAVMVAAGLFLRAPQTADAQDFGVGVNDVGHPWVTWTGVIVPGSSTPVYTVPAGFNLVITGLTGWWRIEVDGVEAHGGNPGPLFQGRGHLNVDSGSAITYFLTGSSVQYAYFQGYLVPQ